LSRLPVMTALPSLPGRRIALAPAADLALALARDGLAAPLPVAPGRPCISTRRPGAALGFLLLPLLGAVALTVAGLLAVALLGADALETTDLLGALLASLTLAGLAAFFGAADFFATFFATVTPRSFRPAQGSPIRGTIAPEVETRKCKVR